MVKTIIINFFAVQLVKDKHSTEFWKDGNKVKEIFIEHDYALDVLNQNITTTDLKDYRYNPYSLKKDGPQDNASIAGIWSTVQTGDLTNRYTFKDIPEATFFKNYYEKILDKDELDFLLYIFCWFDGIDGMSNVYVPVSLTNWWFSYELDTNLGENSIEELIKEPKENEPKKNKCGKKTNLDPWSTKIIWSKTSAHYIQEYLEKDKQDLQAQQEVPLKSKL